MRRRRPHRTLAGHPEAGFALVLTVSLLALLVLVLYGTSVLVRIAAQTADTRSAELRARQNALLGLAVARAALQAAAGPDPVATGCSSIRAKTAANGCLMGVWTEASAAPANWLVSGNFPPDSARSIDYNAVPPDTEQYVTLVGPGTVTQSPSGSRYARAKKIEIPAAGTSGAAHYAFWVEDEGVKASLNVPASLAPVAPGGTALVADPRGEVPSFAFGSEALQRVMTTEQLGYVAPDAPLKSKFHDYTPSAAWVNGPGALQAGLFNVNTTSPESWAAILRAYDAARAEGATALGARAAGLADELTGNLRVATSNGKVLGGPFRSVPAFWSSRVVERSLADAGILDITQDKLENVLSPMLAVRSDTFRIRAYGDAVDPIDGKIQSSAYCEAIAQRTPEMIDAALGRRFVITLFRWLGPDDI